MSHSKVPDEVAQSSPFLKAWSWDPGLSALGSHTLKGEMDVCGCGSWEPTGHSFVEPQCPLAPRPTAALQAGCSESAVSKLHKEEALSRQGKQLRVFVTEDNIRDLKGNFKVRELCFSLSELDIPVLKSPMTQR